MNDLNIIMQRHYETHSNKDFGINLALFRAYIDSFPLISDRKGFRGQKTLIESTVNFLFEKDQTIREKNAELLIKEHWKIYQKKEYYLHFLEKLMKTELGIKIFDKFQRDHIVHSAYVFILGLFLYQTDNDIKRSFEDYNQYDADLEINKFIFMWNIISTFHDVSYPFESFSREMFSYFKIIDQLDPSKNETSFKISFNNLETLSDGINSFDIMQKALRDVDNTNYFNLKTYFDHNLKKGIIDHGILSALFLLKITDILYNERNWNKDFFREIFSEIALAIALHNIDWNMVMVDLEIKKEFLPNITLKEFPFCYLLILADSLQEWDRPAIARPYIPPTGISISFNNVEKNFEVKVALSNEKVVEINDDLKMKISTSDNKKLPIISPAFKY